MECRVWAVDVNSGLKRRHFVSEVLEDHRVSTKDWCFTLCAQMVRSLSAFGGDGFRLLTSMSSGPRCHRRQ